MAKEGSVMNKFFKFFSSYRPVMLTRSRACVQRQQCAGLTRSLEEKLGIPVKPKRPLTPFFRFMDQLRQSYKQKYPASKMSEITKMLARQWEDVEPSTRKQLEDDYKKEMGEYTVAMVKYEGSLTDEQRSQLQQAKDELLDSRNRRKLKKKMESLGKPKRPLSPFLLFLKDKAPERKDQSFVAWHKEMGVQWSALSEQQRARYMEQSQRDMEVHLRELQEWEERMIRLGHIDVVRNEALIQPKAKQASSSSPRGRKPSVA